MGALVPNPNDMQVINALNSLFSEPRITGLRTWMATSGNDKHLFAPGRNLHRIAYRLKIHPSAGTGTNPRGRWFKFIKEFLKERPDGPGHPRNHDIILTALESFVGDENCCTGIRFWARYGAAAELPSGVDYKAVVEQESPDPASGSYWASITLLCRHDLPANAGAIPDPSNANGGTDNNESGAERPNIP
jgi:hypothetical protein